LSLALRWGFKSRWLTTQPEGEKKGQGLRLPQGGGWKSLQPRAQPAHADPRDSKRPAPGTLP